MENIRSVTSSQTAAKKNEDRARAEALRNASLGSLIAADKQLIKSSRAVEVEPSSAKRKPPNNSPSEIFRILGNTSEHLKHRMEFKAQKEHVKDRKLELRAEHKSSSNVLNYRSLSCRSGLLSHNRRLMSPKYSFRLQCLHLFRSNKRSKVTLNCGRC